MGLKSSFTQPKSSCVDKYVNTAYDEMKVISDNIDELLNLEGQLPMMQKYLGAYAEDPSERSNGDPLETGDYYLNTTDDALKYYNGVDETWLSVDPSEILNARDETIEARDAALEAQAQAESAQASAESARDTSIQSAQISSDSALEASNSEDAAKVSEVNAKASETAAAQSAVDTAADAVSTASDAAQTASDRVQTGQDATSAGASATTASQAAAAAQSSEGNAAISAVAAEDAKDAAEQKANEAEASATLAEASKQEAASSASSAATAESGAEQSATESKASEDAAKVSETNAGSSETAAATSATSASTSAATATAKAEEASMSATEAETSAVSAQESLESVEAIEESMYEFAGVMTETQARVINQQNEEKFAASGFVHMGSHYNSATDTSVNEGMTVLSNIPNTIGLGRGGAYGPQGSSKTNFPVTHIAGAVSKLYGFTRSVGGNPLVRSEILLPQAPDGTVIYDSTGDARGSGKSNLDLKVDVDPKYGDIPSGTDEEIQREATSRAFEGMVKNGDGRLSDISDYISRDATINNVGSNIVVTPTQKTQYCEQAITCVVGQEYKASISCSASTSSEGSPSSPFLSVNIFNNAKNAAIASSGIAVGVADKVYTFDITFTATETTHHISMLSNLPFPSGGATATLYNMTCSKVTEEVVTHPVDLAMLEYYEEELTGRQEVMECIQSLSTTFGDTDVPTVLSTRPLSYFQQYDGQFEDPAAQNDQYRCVVWDDLTDEQKRKVAAYMGEKLFVGENGYLVNGRLRARTIRGAGNGDWANVNNNKPNNSLNYNWLPDAGVVRPQGIKDITDYGYGENHFASSTTDGLWDGDETGVFTAVVQGANNTPSDAAYKGRCFAYVVATVPRANQGAYHPSLNPYGCRTYCADLSGATREWYHANIVGADKIHTTKDCFDLRTNEVGYAAVNSGYIGSSNIGSGHPDGIFYDGIEAGGLNGVIDWRLPANPMDTKEEASKVFSKVVGGTYRGLEKLVKFAPNDIISDNRTILFYEGSTASVIYGNFADDPIFSVGKLIWYQGIADSSIWYAARITEIDGTSYIRINTEGVSDLVPTDNGEIAGVQQKTNYWTEQQINLSVSGEFSTQMVIGDPANILLTDALKEGWLGTWCPVIPDGTKSLRPLTRKDVLGSTNISYVSTTDNGTAWTSTIGTLDVINNSTNDTIPGSAIRAYGYKAIAKQTVESTNKPVLNGYGGLGDIYAICSNEVKRGNLLNESLLGKVGTNISSFIGGSYTIGYKGLLDDDGELLTLSAYTPTHTPASLAAPANDSPAVKLLWYQTSDNGQVGLNFAYNELIWETQTPITQADTYTGWTVGELYLVTGLSSGTVFLRNKANYPYVLTNCFVSEGKLYNSLGTDISASFDVWNGSGWGDDSTVRIIDGQGTYVNLNGDTCLYGTNELVIPYGWTSNHARAGTQIEGVDL